ncbi:chloride channel protein 2 [Trichinella spiralis]|uniref:chloride channel protein 2 n=1 Tax=Trichinella spiralis TaxID=6334 RepID=UPI0001EFDD5C|nr:chloride channel protein 2 [Trichinella spiralis]
MFALSALHSSLNFSLNKANGYLIWRRGMVNIVKWGTFCTSPLFLANLCVKYESNKQSISIVSSFKDDCNFVTKSPAALKLCSAPQDVGGPCLLTLSNGFEDSHFVLDNFHNIFAMTAIHRVTFKILSSSDQCIKIAFFASYHHHCRQYILFPPTWILNILSNRSLALALMSCLFGRTHRDAFRHSDSIYETLQKTNNKRTSGLPHSLRAGHLKLRKAENLQYGVDIDDQIIQEYTGSKITRRWSLRLFMNILNTAALNAYVI